MQVLPKSRTLQGVIVPQEDMHIIPNPLLDECRKECYRKAEDEGHEPEQIDSDVGWRRVKGRIRWGYSGRYRNLWSNGGNLKRYLSEEGNILLEVIHRLVCGVNFKALFAVDDKGNEGSRK